MRMYTALRLTPVTVFPSTYWIHCPNYEANYRYVLSEYEQDRVKMASRDCRLWKLFESIFNKILETFREQNETMENYGQQTGLPKKDGLSGNN